MDVSLFFMLFQLSVNSTLMNTSFVNTPPKLSKLIRGQKYRLDNNTDFHNKHEMATIYEKSNRFFVWIFIQ